MFGWYPWTRMMAFEASMCSNLAPDWAIRLWRVEHLVLISTRPRNLSRIARALLLVTRLLRGLLRVDPGDPLLVSASLRFDQDPASVRRPVRQIEGLSRASHEERALVVSQKDTSPVRRSQGLPRNEAERSCFVGLMVSSVIFRTH